MLFLSPTPSYAKKLGQNGPQTGFYRGGHKMPPPLRLGMHFIGYGWEG